MLTHLSEEHDLVEYTYKTLLYIYMKQAKIPEWNEVCFRFIGDIRKKYCADSTSLANCLFYVGILYFCQEKETEAEALLQEAALIYQAKNPQYIHLFVMHTYLYLGTIYSNQNRPKEAEVFLKYAAEINVKTSAVGNHKLALIYEQLGGIVKAQNRLDEAQIILLKAVSILKALHSDDLSDIYFTLAEVYFRQENFAECERYILQTIEKIDKQEEVSLEQAIARWYLALVCMKQGKLVDAEIAIVKGIDILINQFGETHKKLP